MSAFNLCRACTIVAGQGCATRRLETSAFADIKHVRALRGISV